MSSTARRSLVAALIVLAVVGVLEQAREADRFRRELEPTSWGTTAIGHGALLDLFTELSLPVGRSYVPPARLPAGATVWWVGADEACADRDATQTEADQDLRQWVGAGGTAVLFLSGSAARCGSVAGVTVPAVADAEVHANPPPGPTPARTRRGAKTRARDEPDVVQFVTGPVISGRRKIVTSGLAVFVDADGWRVAAAIADRPFVIEQRLGAGRIVAVADAAFLRNEFLDRADAAPLAMDLARAYGAPLLDERAHGLRAEDSAFAYLARSPAWPLFAGLAVLALLVGWRGSAVPPLVARAAPAPAPTLEAFVDSLATLYARTRDHARVLSRYRELTADRLRRAAGLPPETPLAAIAERLRRDARVDPAALRVLLDGAPVRSEADLRRAARALDELN